MNKDDNFDLDPEFNENFHKMIEKVLQDSDESISEDNSAQWDNIKVSNQDAEDATAGDAAAEDALTEDTVTVDVAAEDTAAMDALSVDAVIEDAVIEDAVIEDAVIKDAVIKDAAAVDAATEDAAASDATAEAAVEEFEDVLADINVSLAQQISAELGSTQEIKDNGMKKKASSRKVLRGILISVLSLAIIASFLGFTKPGNELLIKMGVNLSGKIWAVLTDGFEDDPVLADDIDELEESDLESEDPEINPAEIIWPEHEEAGIPEGRYEEGVYNILLLGEEAIDSGTARGRTDLIVIATLNTNQKSIKLTSLMRDTLVQIPGYKDNKLNTAYEKGGLDLLYQTIALNFDIKLEGCAMVNFENFEKIIDRLGGLNITLTAAEAKYLNNTNYISKPQYRNVVEGTQLMNGNQVLGYSRIRKRAAVTGKNNDYGRTDRHRIVLDAIFEKYKTKSKVDLLTTMFGLLPMIDTDIKDTNFEFLLTAFLESGANKIEQLRIPADGTFTDTVKVRGLDALVLDMEENVEILHEFIFGDVKE